MEAKVYLLSGPDRAAKDQRILQLKAQGLPSPESVSFDFDVFYGAKLDLDLFQQSLVSLPAVAERRLIVLHGCEKLAARPQEFLKDYLSRPHPHILLILDTDDSDFKSAFLKAAASMVRPERFGAAAVRTVFDVTRSMSQRRPAEALQILNELMDAGQHPLQVMGGILWFWNNSPLKLTAETKEKGLRLIQEADLNIKRSRMSAENSVEILVVKLCSLLT